MRAKILRFIRKTVKDAGSSGVVLGVSGGVDSAVVAYLCAEAIGPKKILGLFLPYGGATSKLDEEYACLVAEKTGIEFRKIQINRIVDAVESAYQGTLDMVSRGNIKARARMIVLYMHANQLGRLVAGTGNRSELLTGYFTKYGDGASDFLPIGHLYKTEVRSLARQLGVPEGIIGRVPTASLWEGQSDEGELGITYENLDRILKAYFDRGSKPSGKDAERIIKRCKLMSHKLRAPKTP